MSARKTVFSEQNDRLQSPMKTFLMHYEPQNKIDEQFSVAKRISKIGETSTRHSADFRNTVTED